jgi:hypothetical protein
MRIQFSSIYCIIIINFTLIDRVVVRQLQFEIARSHRKIAGSEFGWALRLELGYQLRRKRAYAL